MNRRARLASLVASEGPRGMGLEPGEEPQPPDGYMYHGSPYEAKESILRKGLDPSYGNKFNAIHFAETAGGAESYAREFGTGVLWRVKLSSMDQSKMGLNRGMGGYLYFDVVPPASLEIAKEFANRYETAWEDEGSPIPPRQTTFQQGPWKVENILYFYDGAPSIREYLYNDQSVAQEALEDLEIFDENNLGLTLMKPVPIKDLIIKQSSGEAYHEEQITDKNLLQQLLQIRGQIKG